METLYRFKTIKKINSRSKLLPVLIFTLLAVVGGLNHATAQRANLSDWNVPPPLSPSNVTKGNATTKGTGKTIVLTPGNIPAVQLPASPQVQVPVLADVSTMPPATDAPDQPIIADGANLPDMPLPASPDAPSLPQQSLQDAQIPPVTDVPMPAAPEMPALPPEPVPPGETIIINAPVPVVPDVMSFSSSFSPPGGGVTAWATPGIPENVSITLATPAAAKGAKAGSKGKQKSSTKSHKN